MLQALRQYFLLFLCLLNFLQCHLLLHFLILNVLLVVLLSVERHHCVALCIVFDLRLRHVLSRGLLLELLHQILLLLELARVRVLRVSDWDEDKLLVAVFISGQLLVALDNLIVLIDDLA